MRGNRVNKDDLIKTLRKANQDLTDENIKLVDKNAALAIENTGLNTQITDLKKQLGQCPAPAEAWSTDKIVSVYTAYLTHWEHSRDERTNYNQFFIKLLYVETLVALFGGIASSIKLTSNNQVVQVYPQVFAIIVFAIGAVIAFIWMLKLQTLNHRDNEQAKVLTDMEQCLPPPFQGVGKEVKCQTGSLRELLGDIWRLIRHRPTSKSPPDVVGCLDTSKLRYKFYFVLHGLADVLSYYGIAWLLFFLFSALAIIFWRYPIHF